MSVDSIATLNSDIIWAFITITNRHGWFKAWAGLERLWFLALKFYLHPHDPRQIYQINEASNRSSG